MIHIDEYLDHGPRFRLDAAEASYAFMIFDRRYPVHLYWGARLSRMPDPAGILRPCPRDYAVLRQGSCDFSPWPESGPGYTPSTLPMELGIWGWGDDRPGAVDIRFSDGTPGTEMVYEGWEILSSAQQPEGMPLIHEQLETCETLKLTLKDPARSLKLHMFYTVHEQMNGLIRWMRFENSGSQELALVNPPAFTLDLPASGKSLVRLQGAWASERHVDARPLPRGISRQESRSGAVGHGQTPFIALGDPGAHEFSGTVRAFSLAYSGNFYAQTAVDYQMNCRVSMGVNQYRGILAPGKTFDTPSAVLVYSSRGFSGMSGNFHHLIRNFIQEEKLRAWPRHVIINSWEAMYFDVTEKKILSLARKGKDIGAELLVLDDGWFSGRRNDQSSLGDWEYNPRRFPRGLGLLGDEIRSMGLKFGIWMEPEMVSPDSRLYREHPEWIISIPGREPSLARNQLVLDLSRDEVIDHLKQMMTKVLKEARPDYLKWDMNRNMSEPGFSQLSEDRQGEGMHRYILGLYQLLRHIRRTFPNMIIEGCAGGGGRMDLAMAAYSPRFWTSDQTDAVERLPIQYGSSLIFPPETLGAHVSAVPNHQVGRITSLESRCIAAAAFSFGCELNPASLSVGERKLLKDWSLGYRELRDLIRGGHFFRLRGPLEPGWQTSLPDSPEYSRSRSYAWMLASADFQTLAVFFHRPVKPGLAMLPPLTLPLPDSCFRDSYREKLSGMVYEGAGLSSSGIYWGEADGDYLNRFMLLIRE